MITMDEEPAIKLQVEEIQRQTFPDVPIIIVDSSKDKTPEIAESLGVKVIRQFPPKGYGKAMKIGLLEACKSYDAVITLDCDMTYPASKIKEFVSLLEEGFDCVSASRLLGSNEGMPALNRLGNWLFASFVSVLFGYHTTDITTGMRAYKAKVLSSIDWVPLRFFPCELALRIHQAGYKICERPIEYGERIGEVKMRKIRDLLLLIQAILYCRFTRVPVIKENKEKVSV